MPTNMMDPCYVCKLQPCNDESPDCAMKQMLDSEAGDTEVGRLRSQIAARNNRAKPNETELSQAKPKQTERTQAKPSKPARRHTVSGMKWDDYFDWPLIEASGAWLKQHARVRDIDVYVVSDDPGDFARHGLKHRALKVGPYSKQWKIAVRLNRDRLAELIGREYAVTEQPKPDQAPPAEPAKQEQNQQAEFAKHEPTTPAFNWARLRRIMDYLETRKGALDLRAVAMVVIAQWIYEAPEEVLR